MVPSNFRLLLLLLQFTQAGGDENTPPEPLALAARADDLQDDNTSRRPHANQALQADMRHTAARPNASLLQEQHSRLSSHLAALETQGSPRAQRPSVSLVVSTVFLWRPPVPPAVSAALYHLPLCTV